VSYTKKRLFGKTILRKFLNAYLLFLMKSKAAMNVDYILS